MSLFSRLFGSGSGGGDDRGTASAPEEHDGFAIHAEPVRDGARWRIGARIEKEIDGTMRTHRMIRADTFESADAAAAAAVAKARILIDQQGETIFRDT